MVSIDVMLVISEDKRIVLTASEARKVYQQLKTLFRNDNDEDDDCGSSGHRDPFSTVSSAYIVG